MSHPNHNDKVRVIARRIFEKLKEQKAEGAMDEALIYIIHTGINTFYQQLPKDVKEDD